MAIGILRDYSKDDLRRLYKSKVDQHVAKSLLDVAKKDKVEADVELTHAQSRRSDAAAEADFIRANADLIASQGEFVKNKASAFDQFLTTLNKEENSDIKNKGDLAMQFLKMPGIPPRGQQLPRNDQTE